jgi:F0F1-type ATP synthase assembly protein I
MAPDGNPPDKNPFPPEVGKRAARLGAEVGFSTLFIILGAVFGGLWLDNFLGTRPIIMLILVLGTVPVSLIFTYRMARKAVKDFEESHKSAARENRSAGGQNQSEEGEGKGE